MEHCSPIKTGKKPVKQLLCHMTNKITLKVKEEVEKLVAVKFIEPTRYAEWIANIVHVVKKNGKTRVRID